MNPYVMEELVRQHEQELRTSARRFVPAKRRDNIRRRAGWALLESRRVPAVRHGTDPESIRLSGAPVK